jgi:hypothetical protein
LQYKLKAGRKWATGRVAHVDTARAAINVYIAGKTSPALSLNLSEVVACHVMAHDCELQVSVPAGRHPVVHCIRPGDDVFRTWVATLAPLLGDKMQGDTVLPQPQPAAATAAAASTAAGAAEASARASAALLLTGLRPSSENRGSSNQARNEPSSTATTLAALREREASVVAKSVDRPSSAEAHRPTLVSAAGAAAAGPASNGSLHDDAASAADDSEFEGAGAAGAAGRTAGLSGFDLEQRVAQLEQENHILIQQVRAQEKKVEMQTKSLHRENEELRQEIESQTKRFADQAISILDMGSKLAAEIEERRRLAATLTSLQGNGKLP